MHKKALDILADAISDAGAWQWWHVENDMLQPEFCGVQLYDESKPEQKPHMDMNEPKGHWSYMKTNFPPVGKKQFTAFRQTILFGRFLFARRRAPAKEGSAAAWRCAGATLRKTRLPPCAAADENDRFKGEGFFFLFGEA